MINIKNTMLAMLLAFAPTMGSAYTQPCTYNIPVFPVYLLEQASDVFDTQMSSPLIDKLRRERSEAKQKAITEAADLRSRHASGELDDETYDDLRRQSNNEWLATSANLEGRYESVFLGSESEYHNAVNAAVTRYENDNSRNVEICAILFKNNLTQAKLVFGSDWTPSRIDTPTPPVGQYSCSFYVAPFPVDKAVEIDERLGDSEEKDSEISNLLDIYYSENRPHQVLCTKVYYQNLEDGKSRIRTLERTFDKEGTPSGKGN